MQIFPKTIVDFLSEELGRRWLDVGRRLPGLRNFVRNLSEDRTLDSKNRIVLMLEELYSNSGPNATPALLEALVECRLNRQRDRIQELLRPHSLDVPLCPSDSFGSSYA
ncbi:Death-like domain [Trinorchestia longiramus]|nr:Death-like domain [Trinorchestia longiramus]